MEEIIFKPVTYTLKSGKEVLLRLPTEGDAKNLDNLKKDYLKNTTSIPLTIEEYEGNPPTERMTINKYRRSKNSILLVAEHEGELIGNIDLTGHIRTKMAHTAVIGMGIKEAWRNIGIGTHMIKSVLDWSIQNPLLEVVWLDVYASNELGYNLYKKMGFEVSGVIPNFFKEDGQSIDKVQMYLNVK